MESDFSALLLIIRIGVVEEVLGDAELCQCANVLVNGEDIDDLLQLHEQVEDGVVLVNEDVAGATAWAKSKELILIVHNHVLKYSAIMTELN